MLSVIIFEVCCYLFCAGVFPQKTPEQSEKDAKWAEKRSFLSKNF